MYTCVCGREFEGVRSFNGHKAHCKVHQLIKYGNLDRVTENEKRFQKIGTLSRKLKRDSEKEKATRQWIAEQHRCEHCGKLMIEKFGSGRFCSRACANSRKQTAEANWQRSQTLKEGFNADKYKVHKLTEAEYYDAPKLCLDCGHPIEFKRRYTNVCAQCAQIRRTIGNSKAGRKSIEKQSELRRSKNEKYFCELCENYFQRVRHNEPIFNGWDADVIIEDIKYAVLWNGKWHYEKITDKHSVEQVQNRDHIKIQEIINCGYTPYVIKDPGSYNKRFVEQEFNLFIESLN